MTKTAEEIERLRWCAHLTDLGQAAVPAPARAPAARELELWTEVRAAIEAEEGTRIPVAGDLTSGIERTAAVGGFPTDRVIEEGDPILCDLGAALARLLGRLLQHDRRRRAAGRASTRSTRRPRRPCGRRSSELRPGITMGELDAALRDARPTPRRART